MLLAQKATSNERSSDHIPIINCSTIGPSASAGKKLSAPTMMTTPISQPTNSGVCVGSVPALSGHLLLGGQRAGDRQDRDDQPVARHQHRQAERQVVERRIRAQARRRRCRCCCPRREGVQHFAEAVRAGVEDPGAACRQS